MMRKSDFSFLFSSRPAQATVGLVIAAISFCATILQSAFGLFTKQNMVFFDFVVGSGPGVVSTKAAVVGLIWATIGVIACYRLLWN